MTYQIFKKKLNFVNFKIEKKLFTNYLFFIWTLLLYVFLVFKANFHFDLTDESYYVLSSSLTTQIKGSISQFGYLNYYIFKDLGFNIIAFRIVGILFLFAASAFFIINFLIFFNIYTKSNISITLTSLLFVSATLYFYKHWLLTPSYNYNIFLSYLMVAGIFFNLLRNQENLTINSLAYWIFLMWLSSFFILVAILSKFTALFFFIILAMVTFYFFKDKKKFTILFIILSIFLLKNFFLYIHFFFINFNFFIENITTGKDYLYTLDAGHKVIDNFINILLGFFTAFKFLIFNLHLEKIFLFIYLFLIFYLKNKNYLIKAILYMIILFSFLFFDKLTTPLFLLFLLIIFLILKLKFFSITSTFKKKIKLLTFIIIVPFLFSLGTNNNIISHTFFLNSFYLLAISIIIQLIKPGKKYNLLFTLSVFFLTTNILIKSFYNPYNLGHKHNGNVEKVKFSKYGELYLDEKLAKNLNSIKMAFNSNNWVKNRTIIDLTGTSPGILVLVEGKFIGTAWLPGSWNGSEQLIIKILSSATKEDILQSWILTSNNLKEKNFNHNKILEKLNISTNNFVSLGEYPLNKIDITIWKPRY
jgi:hypothetical protein